MLDCLYDSCEVIVHKDHVGRVLGYVSTRDTHCDTDVGCLERHGVVNAVTCHGSDVTVFLKSVDDPYLMLRRYTCINACLLNDFEEFVVGDLVELLA